MKTKYVTTSVCTGKKPWELYHHPVGRRWEAGYVGAVGTCRKVFLEEARNK